MVKAKGKKYGELYEILDTKKEEKDLYQLAIDRRTELGRMCSSRLG